MRPLLAAILLSSALPLCAGESDPDTEHRQRLEKVAAELQRLRYAPLQAEINANIDTLQKEARSRASRKAYKAFSLELARLLPAGDFAGIAKLTSKYAGKLAPEHEEKAKKDLAFASHVEGFLKWFRAELTKCPVGAFQIDLKLGAASFHRYIPAADRLSLQTKAGAQMDLDLSQIDRTQLVRAARHCAGGSEHARLSAEMSRNAACFLLAGNKAEGVQLLLDTAQADGTDVTELYTRLAIVQRGAKEVEAEELLAGFDKAFKAQDWKASDSIGQKLLKGFGDTRAVKDRVALAAQVDQAHHKGLPLKEYTLTFQQGQTIPEAGVEEYKGTSTASPYNHKPSHDIHRDGSTKMGFGANDALWPMVRFALVKGEGGPLPDETEILDARLSLCKTSAYSPYFELRRLTANWSEDEITWNSAAKGQRWNTPGGDVADKVVASTQMKWEGHTWAEFDVTECLRRALKEGKNFGWRLDTFADGNRVPHANIGELAGRAYEDLSLRPKLIIKLRCRQLKG